MARRRGKGRRRRGEGGHGPSSGTGGGGPLRGVDPVGHVRSTGGGKLPKGGTRDPRRKKGARRPRPERDTSVDKGYDLPPIPDHVAGAETVVQEVIPTRERKRKKRPAGARPARETRSPTEDTDVDALDFLATPSEPGETRARRKTSKRDVPHLDPDEDPDILTESFPSLEDTHTPPLGTPVEDEDDVLEPVEEDEIEELTSLGLAMTFVGSGFGLLVWKGFRALFAMGGVAGLLGGAVALLFADVLPPTVTERIPKEVFTELEKLLAELPKGLPPFTDLWIPLLAGGGFFVLIALLLTRTLKHYRVKNTWVFDQPVSLKIGLVPALFHGIANLILFVGTAGLITPWLIAWNAQSLYQHAFVKARRREKAMDFRGSGFQVLGLSLLTLLTLPLVPLTLGVWAVYLDARWIRWRQSHIVTPSPSGRGVMTMEFQGTWTSLLVRTLSNVLLCALSAGLLQPWATAARWRWIARWTMAGEEEKAKGRGGRARSGKTARRERTGRRRR